MTAIIDALSDHGLVTLFDAPVREIEDWARAVAEGGVRVLGVPVELPNVGLLDGLTGEEGLLVGATGVLHPDHVASAAVAGAAFVISPIASVPVIEAAKARGMDVIAGAMTPTEVATALRAGADLVAVYPAGALGPRYFETVARQFERAPLLAAGDIDLEQAPRFFEGGAVGVVVDRGIFPGVDEPAALEVITARARALVEVCGELAGARLRSRPPRRPAVAEESGLREVTRRQKTSVPPPIPTEAKRRPSAPPPPPKTRPASSPPPIPAEAKRRSSAPPPLPKKRPASVPPPIPAEAERRSSRPTPARSTYRPLSPAAVRAMLPWDAVPPPPRLPSGVALPTARWRTGTD